MSRTLLLMASLVCAVLLLGCAKTENATDNKTAGPEKTTGSAPSSSTPGTTAASSDDKIGVPECDDFIAKYDACVSNKVPEMVRAQYKDAIARWRTEWKKLANDPATRAQLATTCKQAAEQQNAALKSFGCNF
jgi:hypothetical protein